MYSMRQYKLCRLCLCSSGFLADIFNENVDLEFVVRDTIKDLLQLEAVGKDGIPWFICNSCVERLMEFRLFKLRCVESQMAWVKRFEGGEQSPVGEAAEDEVHLKAPDDPTPGITANEQREIPGRSSKNGSGQAEMQLSGSDLFVDAADEFVNEKESFRCEVCDSTLFGKEAIISHILFHVEEMGCHGDRSDVGEADGNKEKFVLCDDGSVKTALLEPGGSCDADKQTSDGNSTRKEVSPTTRSDGCMAGEGDAVAQVEPILRSVVDVVSNDGTRLSGGNANRTGKNSVSFDCSYCGLKFPVHWMMRRHLVCHTKEKPFVCSQCGRRFSQSGNLRVHLKRHSGEKNFGCTQCPKRFSRKNNLQKHLMTHSGAKPFQCPSCRCSFAQKMNFDAHVMRWHKKPLKDGGESVQQCVPVL